LATKTIPQLTALGANVADGDLFELADISQGDASKHCTRLQIIGLGSTGITTLGTITAGTWTGTTIAADRGGTGITSYAVGDLLYASGAATLAKLAGVATGNVLLSGGVGTAPAFGKVTTAHTTGIAASGSNSDITQLTQSIIFSGAGSTFSGNISFGGQIIDAADSPGVNGEVLTSTGAGVLWAAGGSFDQAGNYTLTGTWDFSAATVTFGTVSITTINATSVVFEGSTADANETTLGVIDPTADRAINLPDASGVVALAEVVIKSTAANYTVGTTDPRELYGGIIYVTSAATITLPAVAVGASVTVITIGAIAVSVDPNASDLIYLDGVALSDGDKITNTSTAGDIAVLTYYDATGWYASTNSWTDGN
jgi:hypothetical protein